MWRVVGLTQLWSSVVLGTAGEGASSQPGILGTDLGLHAPNIAENALRTSSLVH